jgi:hypothetical protein
MPVVLAIPLLLSALVGLLLGWVVWGFRSSRSQTSGKLWLASRADVFVWLLALAAFALGAFLTYVLLGLSP